MKWSECETVTERLDSAIGYFEGNATALRAIQRDAANFSAATQSLASVELVLQVLHAVKGAGGGANPGVAS